MKLFEQQVIESIKLTQDKLDEGIAHLNKKEARYLMAIANSISPNDRFVNRELRKVERRLALKPDDITAIWKKIGLIAGEDYTPVSGEGQE